MRLQALLCASMLLGSGCASTGSGTDAPASTRLAHWMTGGFSSAAQASAAPEDYFDIRLFMEPIWTQRDDGPWLYVEQAAASALERPYRQRVYHLVETPEGLRSDVYELPGEALDFAGAWRDAARFDGITPSQLSEREGCSIYLSERAGAFVGATRGEGCASSLGGASFATSEVSIEPDVLTSWDRGFDAAGAQAWGAVLGPYVFVRDPNAAEAPAGD